jgi:hypothetical protein
MSKPSLDATIISKSSEDKIEASSIVILSLSIMSIVFPVYDIGDTVSTSDQNVILNVCDETTEYSMGEEIKLADWNGALNGGNYHVMWLELSASW